MKELRKNLIPVSTLWTQISPGTFFLNLAMEQGAGKGLIQTQIYYKAILTQ